MKKQKKVVVYGPGYDGSNAIVNALRLSKELDVNVIHTLNRYTIASHVMSNKGFSSEHIRTSEKILKNDIPSGKKLYFITLVSDPFYRHVRHTFSLFSQKVPGEFLIHELSNVDIVSQSFLSLPTSFTTQWFQKEFLPSTGINVFKKRFSKKNGYAIYSTDGHYFLVLSSILSLADQESIISDFLGTKIRGLATDDNPPLKSLQDLYEHMVLSNSTKDLRKEFWESESAQYFFSPTAIENFAQRSESVFQSGGKALEQGEKKYGLSRRNILMEDALSPSHGIPYLLSSVGILIDKYGQEIALKSVESILKQLFRAQRNILLASMRTFFRRDNSVCLELAEKYSDLVPDERIKETYIASLNKAGFLGKAHDLLKGFSELNDSQKLLYERLSSKKRALESGIQLGPKSKRKAYKPEKKSILYHVSQALPYHTSGYSTRTQGITTGISKCGWNLSVVTRMGYPCDTKVPLDKGYQLVNDGIHYYFDRLAAQNNGQLSYSLEKYIDEASIYLIERAKEFRPKLIHSASNYITGLAGIKSARKLGIPSIYEMRGLWHLTKSSKDPDYAKSEYYALAHKMELFAAQEADHVISITGALKKFLIDNGIASDKISVAPNAVDLKRFSSIDYDADLAQEVGCYDKIVIGYVGSFVEYEGLDTLIDAVALLSSELREKVSLLWVGDGVYLNTLLERAKEKNVRECIITLGKKNFNEVRKLYSLINICVFPRKGYPVCEVISPLKPFEAMAMKIAVIGSDVIPLKEIIDHEVTGLIHKKEDPVSLCEQLSRFIADKSLRIRCGEGGRAFVETTRNWDKIGESVSEIYRNILS